MTVYYYHNIPASAFYEKWKKGLLPGHLLYGATHLPELGIQVIYHRPVLTPYRWKLSLHTAWVIWRQRKRYDAVYASTFRGLELIIFLRAVGLFPHPIICWHHQPAVTARNPFREALARIFYKGLDETVFFSQKLIDDSLKTKKIRPDHAHVVHWGADLEFYDRLMGSMPEVCHRGFVSTGKELRDMPTLVNAFNRTKEPLDIYICKVDRGFNYEQLFNSLSLHSNVRVHYISGNVIDPLARKVYLSACAVICCRESNYTVGLTTVVEAMALGIPVICSRNAQMPMDIEKEECGITVDYGDDKGWTRAIDYMASHPEEAALMGHKGRLLAEKYYNDRVCAKEIAAILSLGKLKS
jgi:glycosyltransferase involved in cell wall biosynthesis